MPRIRKGESPFARDLLEAMGEVADHVEGRTKLVVHDADVGQVTAARQKLAMTQEQFAAFLSVPLGTVRKWERGENRPSGAAQVLLKVIQREPEAVRRAMAV